MASGDFTGCNHERTNQAAKVPIAENCRRVSGDHHCCGDGNRCRAGIVRRRDLTSAAKLVRLDLRCLRPNFALRNFLSGDMEKIHKVDIFFCCFSALLDGRTWRRIWNGNISNALGPVNRP